MSYPNTNLENTATFRVFFHFFFVCFVLFSMQVLYDTLINQLRGQGFRYGITNDQFHFFFLDAKICKFIRNVFNCCLENKILFSKQQFQASSERYFHF